MKRREKSSSSTNGNGGTAQQTLPTVVPPSRSRSPSPYRRKSIGYTKQRRGGGGRQLCDWIQVLLSLCILGLVFKSVRWLCEATFEADDAVLEASEYSSLAVHVSAAGTGLMNKYFYRFGNVRIRRGRMKFYYDPDGPFAPPTEENWVDIISCNATSASPPTVLVIKVDAPVRWEYMPIDYIPVIKRRDACHEGATSVIRRLAYLLQVRYSYNIWHTWGEAGLMSMFQTLREINMLPIAMVGPTGSLQELFLEEDHDAMDPSRDFNSANVASDTTSGGCPWTFDHALQRPVRPAKCDRLRLPRGMSCSPQLHPWCQPGAVVSPLRDDPSFAPLIVTYTPQSTKNVWSHLYDAISSSQKTLSELDGACFEDLVVGKSSTLNFYQALNATTPAAAILEKVPRIDNAKARVGAMATFKSFIISSQRNWVQRQGLVFEGYADPGLEQLRRGVTDPNDPALYAIAPKECAGNIREEIGELKKNFETHEKHVAPNVQEFERKYGPVVPPATLSARSAEQLRDEESEAYFARVEAGLVDVMEEGGRDERDGRDRAGDFVPTTGTETVATTSGAGTTAGSLPVVTYMSRNFFSRGVVNEMEILRYILENYRVTLKVTTFQEPLLEVMDLLSGSDVVFGMHGAGWTNLLFMKRGATAVQMFPFGWRLPDNSTVRGYNYREIVYASAGRYLEWVNPSREDSYMRRIDFAKRKDSRFLLHPGIDEELPKDSWPGNQWIYQNTYIDMGEFGPAMDAIMQTAGIPKIDVQIVYT